MLISAAGPVMSAMPTPTLYSAVTCEATRKVASAIWSTYPMLLHAMDPLDKSEML